MEKELVGYSYTDIVLKLFLTFDVQYIIVIYLHEAVKAPLFFLIPHLIKPHSDIDTTYKMQFSSQIHNSIAHKCQGPTGDRTVSDTDHGISAPFGTMI